jgi:hypothetical protein
VIAARAGSATVRCSAPRLGLVDPDPVAIQILPGAPLRVFTQLAAGTAVAGTPVGVTCFAFDAFDNEVTDLSYTLATSPSGAGVTTGADSVTATLSGDYEVSCVVAGAGEVETDFLHVLPDLPAALSASLTPERGFYAIDQQVALIAEARDRFGNLVHEVELAYDAAPSIPSPSVGRYLFDHDGAFVLSVAVVSPTFEDMPLSISVPVIVNTTGPVIDCMRADQADEPSSAYMIEQAPSTVLIPVRVDDDFEVASVTIGGEPASLDAGTGNYQAGVPIDFGMNFIDVVAVDELGLENSTTCFVLAAEYYSAEDGNLANTTALRLDPRAISGGQATALDSVNDILHAVLNSQGLKDLIDQGLRDANPLMSGYCLGSGSVTYTGGSINWASASSSMSPANDNRLQAQFTLSNTTLRGRVSGTVCCPGGSNVNVSVSSISANVTFQLSLQGGQLRAAQVGDPSVSVGSVNVSSSCWFGWLDGLFADLVRDNLASLLRDYIRDNIGPMVDEIVSGLDVSTLGQSFEVPRLDGSGTINLAFGLALTSLNITPARFLLGMGTRFVPASSPNGRFSRGIARRTATVLLDPPGTSTTRPVGLSLYEGVLNQVLHGLWRGGYFQAELALGEEGTAVIDARLPPVAAARSSNRAELMLGGIGAVVTIPGIISEPIHLTFGGRAFADVSLVGDDLAFGGLVLDEIFVAFEASLTQGQRDALESFLGTILQGVLADAINDGLPAIPIPSFTLPDSVAEFGLPAGAELGIVGPQLSTHGAHYVLTGTFGVR